MHTAANFSSLTPSTVSHSQGTLLIVDDHATVRDFLSRLLSGCGYHVRTARDGGEALALAREAPPHLVMTEVDVPGLDGCELAVRMRQDEHLRPVPILFFTSGLSLPRVREVAREQAAVSLLLKPADPGEILEAVSTSLQAAAGASAPGALVAPPTRRLASELRLSALVDLGRRLSDERDAGKMLAILCGSAQALLGARYVAAALLSEAGEPVQWVVRCAEHGGRRPANGSGVGCACPAPRPAAVSELMQRSVQHVTAARTALAPCLEHVGSCVVVPIRAAEAAPAIGWLVAAGREGGGVFDEDDANFASALAGHAGGIQERIRLDRQMVDDAALLDGLLDSVQDAVIILDPGQRILRMNVHAVRLFGIPREELIGAPVTDLVAELKPCRTSAGGGDFTARGAEERAIPIHLTWSALAGGGPAAWVLTVRDRSEALRAETTVHGLQMQLVRSQKMEAVGRLAGGIAHDFNNMLTVIAGYSELLLSGDFDSGAQREALEEIHSAADQAGSLTRQLLAFSRREVQAPAPTDVNSVIGDLEKLLRRLVGETISVDMRLAPDLGMVRMDPGHLGQILINLVGNARDAMAGRGRLCLETANVCEDAAAALEPGPYVMLAVSDTGPGMDEETLSRAADPLFAAGLSASGAGLSVVYGIVRQGNGHVEVTATPGLGTTFRIYLPCVAAESAAEQGEATAAPLSHGCGTLLLVEDEEGVRRFTQRVLERDGWKVLSAASGPDAIELFRGAGGQVDLVLTDTVMPQMSGPELGAELRLMDPQVRLLFASGYSDHPLFQRSAADGGADFISKPYRPGVLCRKIREILARPAGAVAS